MKLWVPVGIFRAEDAAAKKRKEIAQRLKKGQDVNVTSSGEIIKPNDAKEKREKTLKVPKGKLAAGVFQSKTYASKAFYWYQKRPELFEAEKEAMSQYFPDFRLEKLSDGKISWVGTLNPRGKNGGVWTLQVVYDNNHPHNNTWGGSLRVYSINPDLNELQRELNRIPHVLRDSNGNLYICTARQEDVDAGRASATSAAKALGWAAKWIYVIEEWLEGNIGKEIFVPGKY